MNWNGILPFNAKNINIWEIIYLKTSNFLDFVKNKETNSIYKKEEVFFDPYLCKQNSLEHFVSSTSGGD